MTSRALLLTACCVASSGCSLIAVTALPDHYDRRTEPRCSTAKWPIVIDTLEAISDAIAIGLAASSNDPNKGSELLVFAGDGLISTISAVVGNTWVSECGKAQDDWDARDTSEPRHPRRETRGDIAATIAVPAEPARREIIEGIDPLYCITTDADPSRGQCFDTVAACDAERATDADTTERCGPRYAAACFHMQRVVDGVRSIVCSLSIRECEMRRESVVTDPDFKQDSRCSVYRAEPPTSDGGGQP